MSRESEFITFGDEVPFDDVPSLVLNGREVWSFGYGQFDEYDEGFTTIQVEDLWAWGIGRGIEADFSVVDSWGPYRVSVQS